MILCAARGSQNCWSFAKIVHSLTKQNTCSNSEGDANIGQFRTLVNCPMNALKFKSFKRSEDFFDELYFETLEVSAESSLGKLLQALFVLHDGQAEVERGISINKDLVENNMKEETITSKEESKIIFIIQKSQENIFSSICGNTQYFTI